MIQEELNEQFRNRTKSMALLVNKKVSDLTYSDALGIIRKQLISSATFVAANFRVVCRARAERERYSKLCIVVEEADETLFRSDQLDEAKFIENELVHELRIEVLEIVKVMSSFRKKLSLRLISNH